MNALETLLDTFESNLEPTDLKASPVVAKVLGYGEISTVFQLEDAPDWAAKRMPLFESRQAAEAYQKQYQEYCEVLREMGLHLPEDQTLILEPPNRPVVLYILQKSLPGDRFAHKLIHTLPREELYTMLSEIVKALESVWAYNAEHRPEREFAIDGQLSNWVWIDDQVWYIDTSTPLYRLQGEEQLDPELFLKSAPSFLRWIIRLAFLKDVMNRYYDRRLVYIDLVANVFKEQKPELVPEMITWLNEQCADLDPALTGEEVEKYYKEDKLIWALFLAFRRIDRWMTTTLFRKRYEFILPGKIVR
ncbi:MAG: hypothetical protein GXO90_00625 [FCB group bacterium]|nr:hypothetical protein [FCB group bacterium]